MKNQINKVTLCGYVGAEVEVVELHNKQKLAKVNLAVNEYYTNSQGTETKKTFWFMLNFWNELATQAANEIKKGNLIQIEGRLQTAAYETKTGEKRYVTNIVVQNMEVKAAEKNSAA